MQNLIFDWFYFIFSDCDDFKDPVDLNSLSIEELTKNLNFVWESKLQLTICNVPDLNFKFFSLK